MIKAQTYVFKFVKRACSLSSTQNHMGGVIKDSTRAASTFLRGRAGFIPRFWRGPPPSLLGGWLGKGTGKQTTPISECKRSLLPASFRKGLRLCPTILLKQHGCLRLSVLLVCLSRLLSPIGCKNHVHAPSP